MLMEGGHSLRLTVDALEVVYNDDEVAVVVVFGGVVVVIDTVVLSIVLPTASQCREVEDDFAIVLTFTHSCELGQHKQCC